MTVGFTGNSFPKMSDCVRMCSEMKRCLKQTKTTIKCHIKGAPHTTANHISHGYTKVYCCLNNSPLLTYLQTFPCHLEYTVMFSTECYSEKVMYDYFHKSPIQATMFSVWNHITRVGMHSCLCNGQIEDLTAVLPCVKSLKSLIKFMKKSGINLTEDDLIHSQC